MSLTSGSRLGPYEVLAPIGAGGMGEVYRARDPRLGRDVAIKILPSSLSADPDRLRRFEQEARAAGVLNHPNITAVYDVGSHDGAPYVVQELLEGETLRSALAGGRLPTRKVVDYGLQIAHGLAAAHEKGIVHRDLKPENLFVTKDGRVKILDFGLAKLTQKDAAADVSSLPTETGTEPGVVLGTLGYMAPEQVRGLPADARSDLFSFGAILYEMLSGRKAFRGDSAADTMSAILKEDPPDLSSASVAAPQALERIVRHCLEKNPEERFQTARDLAYNLSAEAGSPARPAAGGRPALAWAGAALGILVIVGAVLLWRSRLHGPRTSLSPPDRKSIAVLPFQNLSPDPENAFFADGMTEDILTQLAKVRDLKVISRTSVMRYKGTQLPIRTIAAELNVATVLEGSVRRAGGRIRVTGQLIDARTDEHLWAETYDRELKDVFMIQSEVAQQIAAALRAALSAEEKKRIEQRPTGNMAAYDEYLKGRALYDRYRKEENEAAIQLFQKALELDPNFAQAYAGLGDSYAQRVLRFGFPAPVLETSIAMSQKAISLDPDQADGYKALGLAYFVKGAYLQAIEATKKAAEINPSHPSASANVGVDLRSLGRFDEALSWARKAAILDPNNPVVVSNLGNAYAALGEMAEAERWFRRSLELQPDIGSIRAALIWLCLRQGRDADARQEAEAAVKILPKDAWALSAAAIFEVTAGDATRAGQLFERVSDSFRPTRKADRNGGAGTDTYLGYLALRAGNRSQAEVLLDQSLAQDRQASEDGNQDWSIFFDMACVQAMRGQKDEAFRSLERAVEAGWRGWPLGTRLPLLDPLRSDARFRVLETRLEGRVRQMRQRAGFQ
jgi:serine/threonine protein kinase/tetratricopeptide (TPR) repeat protein